MPEDKFFKEGEIQQLKCDCGGTNFKLFRKINEYHTVCDNCGKENWNFEIENPLLH